MMQNSAFSLTDATAEAERYIAWPSQAVAYKVGELTIQRLKKRRRQTWGAKFDPRDFHAVVLGDGAVPLSILEDKVNRYIAAKKG